MCIRDRACTATVGCHLRRARDRQPGQLVHVHPWSFRGLVPGLCAAVVLPRGGRRSAARPAQPTSAVVDRCSACSCRRWSLRPDSDMRVSAAPATLPLRVPWTTVVGAALVAGLFTFWTLAFPCLLYTSDAADDLL